ncbi:hypothetical protein Rs2_26648 [Raphanus sativus]|nr:hypothetical protein Rs2_26648 [Raphanus sativus]
MGLLSAASLPRECSFDIGELGLALVHYVFTRPCLWLRNQTGMERFTRVRLRHQGRVSRLIGSSCFVEVVGCTRWGRVSGKGKGSMKKWWFPGCLQVLTSVEGKRKK